MLKRDYATHRAFKIVIYFLLWLCMYPSPKTIDTITIDKQLPVSDNFKKLNLRYVQIFNERVPNM